MIQTSIFYSHNRKMIKTTTRVKKIIRKNKHLITTQTYKIKHIKQKKMANKLFNLLLLKG